MAKYKLTPWDELSPEAQETIRRNQATEVGGKHINPNLYEMSSFYTDENGNVAKGTDVDKWRWSTQSERVKMMQEDPNYFENLWKKINENWGSGNPMWGTQRVKNFLYAYDRNPHFMDNWKVAENAMDGLNVMSGGILNRLSPTSNIRLGVDWYNGKPIFGNNGSWWGNNGIVTDKLALEYPVLSMLINGTVDGGIAHSINYANNLNKLRRMEKWYTGVPHEELKEMPGTYMDENFPNFVGERWLSDNPDYGKAFISNRGGKVYSVYIDPKELNLMNTPKTKEPSVWSLMHLKYNPQTKSYVSYNITDESTAALKKARELNIPRSERAKFIEENTPKPTSTDEIVAKSKELGYDGTRFYNIDDGYVNPINEVVLNEGAKGYVANSKWEILPQLQSFNFTIPWLPNLNTNNNQ